MTETSVGPGAAKRELALGRAGLSFLLVAATGAALAAPLTLDVGTPARPGPGMWILAAAGCGAFLTLLALLVPSIARDEVQLFTEGDLGKLLSTLPALLLTVPILDYLGVTIAVFLLGLYWLKVPMALSWIRSLIASASVTLSIHVIFIILLRVPFPKGDLTGF